MQGSKVYGRPLKAHRRGTARFRCWWWALLVIIALGFSALFIPLPKFQTAGAIWDRRKQADSFVELKTAGLRHTLLESSPQTALHLFVSWHTLEGAKSSFAALRASFESVVLGAPLCIILDLGSTEVDNSSAASPNDLERFARQLEWPLGSLQVVARDSTFDAVDSLPFSWPASRDDEVALYLTEAVIFEKRDVLWLLQATRAYGPAITDGQALAGLYLGPALRRDSFPSGSAPPPGPFLAQAPCFEGCAFFPGPWRQFQEYHRHWQIIPDSEFPPAPGSPTGGQRWRRHLAEMMCARGMLALHPPLQEGEWQLQQISGRPPGLPPFAALPIFDASLRLVLSPGRLLYSGIGWAMRPLLQSGDPARQALAQTLYGYPGASQCILDHWTQAGHRESQGVEGKRAKGGVSSEEERFLFFSPQFGLSNQLLAYADMAALATVLNRTLVLAPLRQKDGTFIDVESLLDVGKLFPVQERQSSLAERQAQGEKSGGLVDKGEKVRAIRHKDFMKSVMKGRPLRSLIRFDWSNRFGGREKDDAWLTANRLLSHATQQVELPTVAMFRHAMLLLLGGCSAHRVLALDIGFLATAWRQEAKGEDGSGEGRRYDAVRRQLQAWVHRPFRDEVVEQVAASVRRLAPFTCLHLRRGDFAGYCAMIRDQRRLDPGGPYGIPFFASFTYRNCYPRLADLAALLNATSLVPPGQRLYIATNEGDRDLLALHFGDAFDWLDLEALPGETTGLPGWLPPVILDRLVCQNAEVLVGNRWSTFSRSIAQSGPADVHYVGFGQLAALSRPEDEAGSQLAVARFDTWRRAAEGGMQSLGEDREEGSVVRRLAALLDFRVPAPPRACMQQPSEGSPGAQYWFKTGYFRSRLPRHSHDVTLVTYATAAQLGLLRRLLRAWPGVMSLGFCLGPSNKSGQLAALRHLFREAEAGGRARLDVSLLTSTPPGAGIDDFDWEQTFGRGQSNWLRTPKDVTGCPAGLLLEVALDAALTDLVVLMDPFAQPSPGAYAAWAQPAAFRRLREQALGEGSAVRPRWLAVPVQDVDSQAYWLVGGPELVQDVAADRLGRHYVLAARRHLPCLRHLTAADGDGAGTLGRQLADSGWPCALVLTGHFLIAGRNLDDEGIN
ncbi:hypothetical protein KFL_002060020 [Klebsormidium nitens]|uniref:O-fucosyltransferase family protein n=1 Tax=Klebsormidium nitens TaxID=105231 RepID=A0A1Y1I1J3_KLENI|nr:hypothetical protein KFL_002060020 [Klebsormidium nitens]|eukprot:GAQ84780.1 hypothetical protein KFL_002060020 [Klebsormidium nitens]